MIKIKCTLNTSLSKYILRMLVSGCFISSSLLAQQPLKPNSSQIYQQMERLGFLGSVLYVAAHPDDENTRLISYLANEKNAYTTYLSLTRGDGGQNLIGPEMSELLGVIRTQELLMARSVDNGHQMFTRANDFGYSKNAEETIKIWDTEKVKADVVWAIRKNRPDVIINRFDHRTSGETHGHHTASAQLSYELFDKSNDPTSNAEQLKHYPLWQPRRLFFNTSWWFYGSEDKFNKADKSALMSMDVGVFFPLLGKSNTEIAAESRSKHKCQGFGFTGTRGMQMEYLELLKGDMPPSKSDIFEGINTTWSRVGNGKKVKSMVEKLLKTYDFKNPPKSIPLLLEIYAAIQKTNDPFWKAIKSEEVKSLLAACTGLFIEAKTNNHKVTRGENINIEFEAINRQNTSLKLLSVYTKGCVYDTVLNTNLKTNDPLRWTTIFKVPENAGLTPPYWLTKKGTSGMYNVDEQSLIGLPETPRTLKSVFTFEFNGIEIQFEKAIVYKFNSPENGETYRPLEIVPAISLKIKEPVYIFPNSDPKDIKITVTAWHNQFEGKLTVPMPDGWKITPSSIDFQINQKGESKEFIFRILPPGASSEVTITPVVFSGKEVFDSELIEINYDHIPFQIVVKKSITKLSRIDLQKYPTKIAYVMGAGDEIPVSLRQIGYDIDIIKTDELNEEKLKKYQALIFGVRAYNTEETLKFKQKIIFNFIENGGNVIVQYNTSNGLVTKEISPYPFTISRNRVTVEDAEIKILKPGMAVLNVPNKITDSDFKGWVQERGLYFAGEWDNNFTPVFACNDPGEKPQEGSLIIAKYGKGYYTYTGISFFRQLPAGVSGAYRLFANLISLGNDDRP